VSNKHHLIYIVDDEVAICELLQTQLAAYGYSTQAFQTGVAARAAIAREVPDLCIVDLGLPDMDGLQLVRELMDNCQTGVIILSGRGSLPDKVLGLELGADDYISKPFEPRELIARVNSIIRRIEKASSHESSVTSNLSRQAHFDDWCFDVATLTLSHHDGRTELLSAAEAELLLSLLQAPRQILSRDQLMNARTNAFDRCIDVRMSRIRKKIEPNPKSPKFIKTVYGAGYMFTSEVQWASH